MASLQIGRALSKEMQRDEGAQFAVSRLLDMKKLNQSSGSAFFIA